MVVHGAPRDSGRYLGHAGTALARPGARMLVIAPQFLADVDVAAGVVPRRNVWDVEGWKGGQPATGPATISSFTAMDRLLLQLAGPARLPGRGQRAVVIVGNSAGGQYVSRYAAVGQAPDVAHDGCAGQQNRPAEQQRHARR